MEGSGQLVSSSTRQSHQRQVKVDNPPLKSKSPRRFHSRRTGDARPCRLLFQGLQPPPPPPPVSLRLAVYSPHCRPLASPILSR